MCQCKGTAVHAACLERALAEVAAYEASKCPVCLDRLPVRTDTRKSYSVDGTVLKEVAFLLLYALLKATVIAAIALLVYDASPDVAVYLSWTAICLFGMSSVAICVVIGRLHGCVCGCVRVHHRVAYAIDIMV
jgi:hypothetical protein